MTNLARGSIGLGLVAVGYLLGASGLLAPPLLRAQPNGAEATDETVALVKDAHQALTAASQALEAEGLYVPATGGLNAFVVLSGGADVIADLESGRGVDPETFAALYAGRATEEVTAELGRDEEGRLTYKKRVIRMYPITRLQQMFAEREKLAGVEADPFDP